MCAQISPGTFDRADEGKGSHVSLDRAIALPGGSTLPRGEKVASRVARLIVEDIVESGRQPGDALEPESLMLERFGISRASPREALRILETQGLITIKPGPRGGPSVGSVSSRDFGRMATLFFQVMHVTVGDVLEARLVLEPVMARMAAERHDPELNEMLRDNVAAHRGASDDRSWLAVTHEFHAMVCGMSGNPLLNILALSLKDIYTDRVAGYVFPEENRDHVWKTHGDIAEAIITRDAATAERLMLDHMAKLAEFFEARYPGLMAELVQWR
jgi:GntR family transcriptional regulator, transcriptional repressor for pyruvate dehydrogenase complex